jgi:hypothetical protein
MSKCSFFRFRLRSLFVALTIVCVFFAYVASYFTLLNPTVYLTESAGGIGVGYREADYRAGGNVANIVFTPIHYVDHAFRPDYWDSYCTLDDYADTQH